MRDSATRRSWMLACTTALAATLSGCGFELRRAPELRFRSVQLAGFGSHSSLADELRSNIDASQGTKVVDAGGEVVLESLADTRDKFVAASNSAGQVLEFTVRSRFKFRLRTPTGKELIAPTELSLTRDMSYTESAALAKEQEESLLYRAMQTDIVAQVMRRLAAVPAI